jgi:hypothetical protein
MVDIDSLKDKFANQLKNNSKAIAERIDDFYDSIEKLKSSGCTRYEMFLLIQAVLLYEKEFDEKISDLLDNYYTAITGDCATECVERFVDDPADIDDKSLQSYVWSRSSWIQK